MEDNAFTRKHRLQNVMLSASHRILFRKIPEVSKTTWDIITHIPWFPNISRYSKGLLLKTRQFAYRTDMSHEQTRIHSFCRLVFIVLKMLYMLLKEKRHQWFHLLLDPKCMI